MAYLGSRPDTSFRKLSKQTITGNGGTTYTLNYPVNNSSEIEVYVNNVRQEPDVAYTATYTTLTMTGAVQSYDSFYVVYQGQSIGTLSIPEKDNSGNYSFDNGLLYLDAANNRVGIGTIAPTHRLTIPATGPAVASVGGILIGTNGTDIQGSLGILSLQANGANYIGFNTNSAERMRIDATGNVGIGLSGSPGYKLHVSTPGTGTAVSTNIIARLQSEGTGRDVCIQFSDNVTNAAYIGMLAGNVYISTFGTERMRVTTAGEVLIGTTDASATAGLGLKLYPDFQGGAAMRFVANTTSSSIYPIMVRSTSGAGSWRYYVDYAGTIYAVNTTIVSLSDVRLKENIRDLNVGLDAIMQLKPRLFDWKQGRGADKKNARGFIAHEFEQVFPDMISQWAEEPPDGEEPYKAVSADLIPVLVKAIQEQQAIIENLKARIEALEV